MSLPLAKARYLNLATFRKSGVAVETPVWFAEINDRLYVFSAGNAGKVKRLRNSPRSRIAPCDMKGQILGSWQETESVLVSDSEEVKRAHIALRRKYGWQMALTDLLALLSGRLQSRAYIAISLKAETPDTGKSAAGD